MHYGRVFQPRGNVNQGDPKVAKANAQFTAVDLFCGCGGLTQGLRSAGFNVIGSIELDAVAVATYRLNHPDVRVWHDDIRAISPESMRDELGLTKGELDLLAGCPPCQGFSTLRTLNGKNKADDPRNDLVSSFERFVEAFLPRSVMLENVPGLQRDARFLSLCGFLHKLGYKITAQVEDAQDYGVPQRRLRLILLAGYNAPIDQAVKRESRCTVRDAIGNLAVPGSSGDPIHDLPERRSAAVKARITAIPKNGGSRSSLSPVYQLECHHSCNGFKDVYGRMAWDDVSPTLTTGCFNPSKGRFLHPEQDRAISMREAALLQSFPEDYKFSTNHKTKVAMLIGNALPPEFIRTKS